MAITVAQVEAIISVQTNGFDKVVQSIKQLSDNFEKTSDSMLAAINKIEKSYDKIGTGATKAGKIQKDAVKDVTESWNKQNKMLFAASEQLDTFANKAKSSIGNTDPIVQKLRQSWEGFSKTLSASIMDEQTLTQVHQNWVKTLNDANRALVTTVAGQKALTQAEKDSEAATNKNNNALQSQSNSIMRAEQQYKNLIYNIQSTVTNERQQIEYTRQATDAFNRLKASLSGAALSTGEATRHMLGYNAALNEIKRNSGIMGGMNKALGEFGRLSQLAFGPMAGYTSRLNALISLMDDVGMKNALMAASFTSLAVGWGLSIKAAANFEFALTKVSAAAGTGKKETEELGKSMLELSKDIMIPTNELLKIAQAAAQAGVSGTENLTSFTRVVASLTRTSSLTADSASDSILELANVTKYPITQLKALGDIITKIGSSSVGSETKVLTLATEVAKAGAAFGFTAPIALAWAGALADTGQEAESASTAVVSGIQNMGKIIAKGGPQFEELAKFIGMTGEELRNTFEKDGSRVLQLYLKQLGKVTNVFDRMATMEAAGIVNVRSERSLSALSTAAEKLDMHLKEAGEAAGSLDSKMNKIGDTAKRQWEGVTTNIEAIGISIGNDVLGPLVTMLKGIKDVTSATDTLATAFKAAGLVITTIGLTWAGKGAWAMAASVLNLTSNKIYTVQTAAQAAAGSFTLTARAVTGLSIALKALWPVLAVEAIVWAIGKLRELREEAELLKNMQQAAPTKFDDKIKQFSGASNVNLKEFFGTRSEIQKEIDRFNATRKDLIQRAFKEGSPSEGPSNAYDLQIAAAEERINNLTGALKRMDAVLGQTKQSLKANGEAAMQVAGTEAKAALKELDETISRAGQSQNLLKILKTQGIAAYNRAKIRDDVVNGLKPKLESIGGDKTQQKLFMQGTLDKFQSLAGSDKGALSQLSAAVKNGDFEAGKAAIVALNTALAENIAKTEETASSYKTNMGKIESASERAENSIVRSFAEANAQLEYGMDVLSANSEAQFRNLQNSRKATKEVKDLEVQIKKMSKEDLADLQKALGTSSSDFGTLAEMMYNTLTAASAASKGIEMVNQAIERNRDLQLDLQNNKEGIAFERSLMGLSDYDKQIAMAGFSAQQPFAKNNADIQSQIGMLLDQRSATNNAETIDGIDKTIAGLKNQMKTTEQLRAISVDASKDIKKSLDLAIYLDPQIAVMDTLRSSFVNFGVTAVKEFDNIGDAFLNFLDQIRTAMLQNMIFQPISDWLFGKSGGIGGGAAGGDNIGGSFLNKGLDAAASWVTSLLGFAEGGTVVGNKPILVGERGPEVFVPGANGQIVNNNDAFGGVGASSGGGGSINVHVTVSSTEEFDAKVVGISGDIAGRMISSYDTKTLPSRVNKINKDPRAR